MANRKINSPLVNRKLSPPYDPSNWNAQRHSPHYHYGGSVSATPSPNFGRRNPNTKPVYWDSQHVRLQGNTSPIGKSKQISTPSTLC